MAGLHARRQLLRAASKLRNRQLSGWRAEWKYDGERLQIHAEKLSKKKIRYQLFSRDIVAHQGFVVCSCSNLSLAWAGVKSNVK